MSVADAFAEGLHREQALTLRREGWTWQQWWDRKLELDEWIEQVKADGADRLEIAGLQGRLMCVCAEGRKRFGS